jgi:hypothetical protein
MGHSIMSVNYRKRKSFHIIITERYDTYPPYVALLLSTAAMFPNQKN